MLRQTVAPGLLLLPLFLLLHSCNGLFGFLPPGPLLFDAAVIYACVVAGWLGLGYATPLGPARAAMIAFILSLFVLFFNPLKESCRAWFGAGFVRYLVFLPVCALVLSAAIALVVRARRIAPRFTMLVNVIMICLVATELGTTLVQAARFHASDRLIYPGKPLSEKWRKTGIPDSAKPDVFFILVDEFANNRSLMKHWGYDNGALTGWLAGQGFDTPSNTHSNYSFTLYSMSSMFNMAYLDPVRGRDGTNPRYLLQGNASIGDNELFYILRKEGYQIRFLAPFSNPVENNGLGFYFDYLGDQQIFAHTLVGQLYNSYHYAQQEKSADDAVTPKLRDRFRLLGATLDAIRAAADTNGNRAPRFVYGHLFITHDPHMFNAAGGLMTKRESQGRPWMETYPAQVRVADSVIRDLAGWIATHNRPNTVIIVMGDHGFRGFPLADPSKPQPDSLHEALRQNFFTIRFPDRDYRTVSDSLTPVNLFRVFFNKYFSAGYPLLADSGIIVKDQ